jgi:crotonobetainyl-CoA:carnitine CoA-transferase CaiB-like acyl-CoA transferase
MLDSTAALLTYQAAIYFSTGEAPRRMGNRHPTIVPYETYTASDGDFVVAVGNDGLWRSFCAALGVREIADDPRFSTNQARVSHYDALRPLLAAPLARRTRSEWIGVLKRAGVPCGSVRDVGEVLLDPQLDAREMIATVEHSLAGAVRVLGVPVKLSVTPGAVRTAPPALGEHTRQILERDIGLTAGEIDELRSAGAI